MKKYCVQLLKAEHVGLSGSFAGDHEIIIECDADSFDHAIAKTLDLYPGADITECVEEEAIRLGE